MKLQNSKKDKNIY